MKLINKIKPEILEVLKNDTKIKYRASYATILISLNSVENYRDLTIRAIDTIILFLPIELHPKDRTDFYFGDYLLKKQYQT
jgi:hypothetical protein